MIIKLGLSRKGIKKKIASLSLISMLLNLMMVGTLVAPSDNIALAETETGSIKVCKVIINGDGAMVDGSANAGTFVIPGIPSIAMPNSNFATPISFVEDVVGYDDAACVVHDNLPLESYWYGEEIITGNNWLEPKYNDQFTDTVTTLNDFYLYNESGNDQNADGNIVLTSSRPDRTLVVLNQYITPKNEVTIVASKVVCDDELDLPNWGGDPSSTKVPGEPALISENTAQAYVTESEGKCYLADDWYFQYGDNTAKKEIGAFYGESADDSWTTFGPTVGGKVETTIDISNIAENPEQLRLREVLQDGYIPFTYDNDTQDNSNNVSAEFYCSNDMHNYDNYDYINNLVTDETYYCVAFNTLEPLVSDCGNGEIDPGTNEQCDFGDNNGQDGSSCSDSCQWIDPIEECAEPSILTNVDPIDSVDVGNLTSEIGHNLVGWSSANIPGGYGGCDNGNVCTYRQVIEETGCDENSRSASFTLEAGGNYATSIKIKHLDGLSNLDSFDIYIEDIFLAHYTDLQDSSEIWYEHSYPLNNLTGTLTVKITATDGIWASCPTYGQLAISSVEISGYECLVPDLACEVGVELIENGGFEAPIIPSQSYEIYSDDTLTSWYVEFGDGLEIQNNIAGAPHFGNQHAELDSNNSSAISQEISTFPGANYLLTFWYSPRPENVEVGDNKIGIQVVSANSTQLINETVGDTSIGASTTNWQEISYDFIAQENMTKVVFSDLGISNSLGGYLDDISVKAIQCEVAESVTVVASKIVCENEDDLPNWGGNTSPVTGEPASITSDTAIDYVASHSGCHLAEGWSFQIGENQNDNRPIKYAGDYYGEATFGDGWTTFGPTNSSGKTQTTVVLTDDTEQFRLREVLQDGYIPFTYDDITKDNTNDVSAEFYCYNDIHVYDNYDYIRDPQVGETYYCVAFNAPKPSVYGPYCGDGIVNQDWEECDPVHLVGTPPITGCSVRCQQMGTPVCSEDVFARVVVTDVENEGNDADMTNDIYLGGTIPTPQGAWFPLYYDGVYMNDFDDIDTYQDVPGLAVQRLDGEVRVQIYGSHPDNGTQEHIEGYLEFFNEEAINSLVDDTSPGNKMEGNDWNTTTPDSTTPIIAGYDYAWIDGNKSHFWMTVTTADDGYFTPYETPICDECSVFGHKYNEIGIGLVNWVIGLAQIVDCATNEEWADSVADYVQGTGVTPEDQVPAGEYRGYSWQALDVAERDDTVNFVSLGIGGELILEFDNLILNGTGDDIEVVETSFGDPTYDDYKEKAKVYASQNTTDWSYLGTAYLDEYFDLANGTLVSDETTPFVLDWVKYLKIVDTSIQQGDGYDVDGVKALHCGNYETVTSTTTDNSGAYCFADVDSGNYAVYEEMKSGWSIWDVLVGGQSIINYFVDSFFDVFVEVEVVDGETTTVDFYNKDGNGPVDPTLTVNKVLNPNTDPGRFNLLINNVVKTSDIGDGGTTGAVSLSAGTYTVSETAGTGTNLNDYITTFSGDCDANGDITLGDEDNAVCIITNTIKTIQNGNVIINEIAWMGTDNASVDEWIELRNMTDQEIILDGWTLNAQNDFPKITLEGSIAANGYYLLERTDDTTVPNITADKIYTGALEDGGEFLKLRKADNTLVDEVDASNNWQAGIETTPKHPMELCSDSNWYDSDVAGGTPRSKNGCGGNNPFCGNGKVEGNEKCDDNNNDSFDGCSSSCQIESIFGYKFNDENNNGADDSEPKLSDWTIELYDDANMITPIKTITTSSVTAIIGYYSFENLGIGDYWIKEIQQSGWIQTTPITSTEVNLQTATSTEQVKFGNRKTQCFDGVDNDTDTLIDANDPGCWTDENDSNTYNPNDDNENNGTAPVYQCSDGDDNDGDGLIDTNDPGCHTDWDANNASTYVPTDNDEYHPYCGDGACNNNETCSTCSVDCGNCGGGGGGGIIYPKSIIITNEKVIYLGGGEAMVTWTTNVETTRQVAYGDDSISALGIAPEYGYDSVNTESTGMTKEHDVTIGGLTDGIPYYFRPIADRAGSTGEKVGIEVFYEPGEVKGIEASEEPCTYLLEYVKLGANNNPIEVMKVETFLNVFEGEKLAVNGIYELVDFQAVSRFQAKYFDLVLAPWSHNSSTGYVYITTKKRINEIYCQTDFPLTEEQASEVALYASRFGIIPVARSEGTTESGTGDEGAVPGGTTEGSTTEDGTTEDGTIEGGTTEGGTTESGETEEGEVQGAEDEQEELEESGESEGENGEDMENEDEGGSDVLLIGGDEDDEETTEDGSIIQSFQNFSFWTWLLILIVLGAIAYYFLFVSKGKKKDDIDILNN